MNSKFSLLESGLKLQKPLYQIKEGVETRYPLQSSFCYLIIGQPGSGKTYLLKQLVCDQNFYRNKFDKIIYLSPSKIDGLEMNYNNWITNFDLDSVYKFIEQLNNFNLDKPQLLVIFDDQISLLNQNQHKPQLCNLFFNRRHLLNNNGTIHLLITTQKYIFTPTAFRTCYTGIFFFDVNNEDWKQIKKDCFLSNSKYYEQILPELFSEKNTFLYVNMQNNKVYKNFDEIQFK